MVTTLLLPFILSGPVAAGRMVKILPVESEKRIYETGLAPFATGSDSVFCCETLLSRQNDYSLNARTGILTFSEPPDCDSLTVIVFQLPAWLTEPAGNPVPQGKRLIQIESPVIASADRRGPRPQKITLTGNKSFSFIVGRSGTGRFSQGLNLDFDARIADDLRLRGSVSDKIGGAAGAVSGAGGTTILSDLDKYFFEIEGRRLIARGGDIETADSRFLPDKRIRGMSAAYAGENHGMAVDIGRPAGKFIAQQVRGEDSRQGPYQAMGGGGRPVGVVPGSEKVHVDGQLLEGGSDKHYLIDYPSGRITFSPRVLITSRSRIEIDFEAAENDYEQAVYDAVGNIDVIGDRLRLEIGARRETDEKDRLRFGSYSPAEITILQNAGDSASRAFRSGVSPDTGGNYTFVADAELGDHYEYVGSGSGEYSVAFSPVGEGRGDYRYLGDGIHEYAGKNAGDYLPIVFLPLPSRNDYLFGALDVFPYQGGSIRLAYQGNIRDNNLFSSLDDKSNFKSQLEVSLAHQDSTLQSRFDLRFRQEDYNPVSRLNRPDFDRLWALPSDNIIGDELRLETRSVLSVPGNRFETGFGYLGYKDDLRSHRIDLAAKGLENLALSPRVSYRSGNSRRIGDRSGDGLYERLNAGLAVKPVRPLRLEIDIDRELAKDRHGAEPDVEKYVQYRSAAFYRNTILTVSRRIESESAELGTKGPQLDKIELVSDENIGRLKIKIAGTYLEQKQIDSEREDQTERLFETSMRYTPSSGWLNVQAEYRQNRRRVRSTGDLYLQVGSGQGEYRFEDGRYLYDPDGDYIRIKEETGETVSVSTGEKSHNIMVYPGRLTTLGAYRKWLSQIALRLRTEVIEELPGKDRRRFNWVLPWTSRSDVDYLQRSRREGYSVLLFPTLNFYILSFSYSNLFKEQDAGEQLSRHRREYDVELKNSLSPEVRTTLQYVHRRNRERGVGLIALALIHNEYIGGLIINQGRFRMAPRLSYLRFHDDLSPGEGRGVWIGAESVYRQPGRGEIRLDIELRSLTEKIAFDQPEYLVTDGRRFGKSAQIDLIGNYDLGKSLRLTVNLTERIFEGRPAEFTGRGELIARF